MSSAYGPPPPPQPRPAYGPPLPAAQPGRKKKVVWIAIAAVLGGLLLIVLFVGLFVVAVFGSMRSSDPYRFAVQTATHDPRVLSRLGSPVKPGWLCSGSISVQNDSGQADLSIPVQGSARKGTIHVVGKKSEGVWKYEMLLLAGEDGQEQLDLLPQTKRTEEK